MYIGRELWYDDTMNKNATATVLHLLLIPAFALAALIVSMTQTAEGGWIASNTEEKQQVLETAEAKAHNVWTTKALEHAGWTGCEQPKASEQAAWAQIEAQGFPVAHVVRTSVSDGFAWVRMPANEVAHRLEAFGGTKTVRDDVKVVGNCW